MIFCKYSGTEPNGVEGSYKFYENEIVLNDNTILVHVVRKTTELLPIQIYSSEKTILDTLELKPMIHLYVVMLFLLPGATIHSGYTPQNKPAEKIIEQWFSK